MFRSTPIINSQLSKWENQESVFFATLKCAGFNWLIILVLLLNYQLSIGQSTVQSELYEVGVEKGLVKTWIKVIEEGKPAKLKRDQLQLTESFTDQKNSLEVFSIEDTLINESVEVEKSTVLILVDVSRFIKNDDLEVAKAMISEIIRQYESVKDTYFYLTAFAKDKDKQINHSRLTSENLDQRLSQLLTTSDNPDFNRILIDEIRFLKGIKGKKVLFVMGSGENDIAGQELYNNMIPYDSLDVKNQINNLPDDFTLFCVGLNDKLDHRGLQSLISNSSHYSKMSLPEAYPNALKDNVRVLCTHLVKFKLKDYVFRGEKRNYTMTLNDAPAATFSLRYGSSSNPVWVLSKPGWKEWGFWFLFGLTLIVAILFIASTLVPALRNRAFIKNYVSEYIPEGQIRVNDPVYNEPIQAGELVVKRCQQMVPLATWKDIGMQCPNYPDCMDPKYLGCNGAGAPIEDDFFSRKGVFNQLNWMWYGAIGGFLAWIFFVIFNIANFQGLQVLISKVLKPDNTLIPITDSKDPEIFKLHLQTLNNDLLLGISFGFGLMFMLSYIVELSDSRQFSWLRVIVKTLLGMFVSSFVFYAGFYIQYSGLVPNEYLSGLITWLLFGLSLGIILSISSNIVVSRGILGGLLASFIAFNVYFGISFFSTSFISAKLISLIVLGAILGLVLVTVITSLENFELEFIAPKGLQSIPISKWLKNNQKIFMGKDPGNYIYLKWEDSNVLPKHAQLMLENGTVYIQPLAETLVNKKVIDFKKKTPLKNKDMIQLGRGSSTILQYREKHTSK